MTEAIAITAATAADAPAIAAIHLAARRTAMPYLRQVHDDQETRAYFAAVVADRPGCWWVARRGGAIAGYALLRGEWLEHLYVAPARQGAGLGAALLAHAKAMSPGALRLWTFQRNHVARAFYERFGFRAVEETAGENEEGEPDVQYAWNAGRGD